MNLAGTQVHSLPSPPGAASLVLCAGSPSGDCPCTSRLCWSRGEVGGGVRNTARVSPRVSAWTRERSGGHASACVGASGGRLWGWWSGWPWTAPRTEVQAYVSLHISGCPWTRATRAVPPGRQVQASSSCQPAPSFLPLPSPGLHVWPSRSACTTTQTPPPKRLPLVVPGRETGGVDTRDSTQRVTTWWLPRCEFMAYSAHGSCVLQDAGLWEHRQRNTVSNDWLARSVWPFDWGWKPEDKLTDVPSSVQKAFQNLAVNWGPLSETISLGIPCSLTTWVINSCAVSEAEGSLVRGTKCTALENWSIIMRIVVWWLEGGRPVTKSKAMWGRWGMGGGCNNPCGDWCMSLAWAQTEQAATKFWTSSIISGHQNLRCIKVSVLLAPRWPEKREECPHLMTCALIPSGTYWRLSGQLLGAASYPTASLTDLSMSIPTAWMNTSGCRMVSGGSVEWGLSKYLERASGLTFFAPGQ